MSAFTKQALAWIDSALSFIYPDVCQLCGRERATRHDGYVGMDCRRQIRYITPPFCERCGLPFQGEITGTFECANCREMELHFVSARSAVLANETMLQAIHRYKYNGQMWFENFLAEFLVREATPWFEQHPTTALVPVPLFPVKQRERGFNQAERLARRLSRGVDVPMRRDLLKRVLPTPSQTRLTRTQRADNMRSAFALRRHEKLKGGTFVLIDDVFTTGATTSACARLLIKAGAERVSVWTVARAEFHG